MITGSLSTADLTRLTGALAGGYRLERELGAGGMATVCLAHDTICATTATSLSLCSVQR